MYAIETASRRAGPCLDYSRGCPECCIGPFPIARLDARRLRRGLRELERRDPEWAKAVKRRALEAAQLMAPRFPGDAATGVLDGDEAAEERFCEQFACLPCPALDPSSGRCELYAFGPLSCRTFGPPVRIGEEDLPPCHLCFRGSPEEIERCRAEPDAERREEALLAELERREGVGGETVIAFALAPSPPRPSR